MSKILISFVGTGGKGPTQMETREYRTALYKYEGKNKETKFVAQAMKAFFKPDKIFLIGTPHSMWEEVYRAFSEENKPGSTSNDIWAEICEHCDKANNETPAKDFPHQEDIEKAMGEGSKIFLIRYGLNEEQIQENIDVILGIRDYLNNGDEIIVDITHSFRSLPLLIMQLIFYLRQVESPKVNVSHVFYGMLDVGSELKYVPIVDLSKIIELNDWIAGAYAFKLTGSAEKICKLIEKSDKPLIDPLKRFSDLLNLNALGLLQNQVSVMSSLANRSYPSKIEDLAIKPTASEFAKTFKYADTAAKFQYKLAKWQYEKMNYLASYTTLVECIITKACELRSLNWGNFDDREQAKDILRGKYPQISLPSELTTTYKCINSVRNELVHQNKYSASRNNASRMLRILEEAIKALPKVI